MRESKSPTRVSTVPPAGWYVELGAGDRIGAPAATAVGDVDDAPRGPDRRCRCHRRPRPRWPPARANRHPATELLVPLAPLLAPSASVAADGRAPLPNARYAAATGVGVAANGHGIGAGGTGGTRTVGLKRVGRPHRRYGHCIELALVHRIGGLRTCRDIGELAVDRAVGDAGRTSHSCAAHRDTVLARSASEPAPNATLLPASLVVQVLLPSTVALLACVIQLL